MFFFCETCQVEQLMSDDIYMSVGKIRSDPTKWYLLRISFLLILFLMIFYLK